VPKRAPPGDIWYTFVQTTGAVYGPGTLTQPRVRVFRQERAHAGRCCLCGSLLRRPLFRLPLSSVGIALGCAERPIVAVLSMWRPCGAVWCRLRPRHGLHLPALAHKSLIFLEILPHDGGDQQRQRNRLAVLLLIRRRIGLQVGMEVGVEPTRDRHRLDGDAWETNTHGRAPSGVGGLPGS